MYKKVVDWVVMMCPNLCFTYHTPPGTYSLLLAYLPTLFLTYFSQYHFHITFAALSGIAEL